jgi:hypothetical protein
MLTFKFFYKLFLKLRTKALKYTAGLKLSASNIKLYKKVYKYVKNKYAVLKEINNLVQKQKIKKLFISFKSLKINTLFVLKKVYLAFSALKTKKRKNFILLLIKKKAYKKHLVTNKEIDNITKSLKRLQILQTVAEKVY